MADGVVVGRRLPDMPPLPLEDEAFMDAANELITRVNGFVYDGDRMNAILGAVRAMRDDPGLTRQLLAG